MFIITNRYKRKKKPENFFTCILEKFLKKIQT